MNKMSFYGLVTLITVLFSLNTSIAQEIEIKDGIKYIHNKEPKWGKEPKVKLEFIQEIGGMDVEDKNYLISNLIMKIRLLKKGLEYEGQQTLK